MFFEKGILKNFAKFTGKYFCRNLKPETLLKKRLQHRPFPVNFAIFLRTYYLYNTSAACSCLFICSSILHILFFVVFFIFPYLIHLFLLPSFRNREI